MTTYTQPLTPEQAAKADVYLSRITKTNGAFDWQVSRYYLARDGNKQEIEQSILTSIVYACQVVYFLPKQIETIKLTGHWKDTIWQVEGDDYTHEWSALYPLAQEGMLILFDALHPTHQQMSGKFPVFNLITNGGQIKGIMKCMLGQGEPPPNAKEIK